MTLDNRLMIRAVALDLDGVVYEGDHVIKGALETISVLRERGVDIYFVTNNSGKKRASIAAKMGKMGINSDIDHIITSGYASAVLVNSLCHTQESRILVIGSEELEEEVRQLNRLVVHELPADFLIVGFDRDFNYDKLSLGLNALRQGAAFVACNRDRAFPVGGGQVLPACGPMVAAMEWAWGKKADYVAGKPNPMMLELTAQARGFKPHEILVVGDTIDSDIAMADQFGCPSVLIASGNSHNAVGEEISPQYTINSIEQLIPIIYEGS